MPYEILILIMGEIENEIRHIIIKINMTIVSLY